MKKKKKACRSAPPNYKENDDLRVEKTALEEDNSKGKENSRLGENSEKTL